MIVMRRNGLLGFKAVSAGILGPSEVLKFSIPTISMQILFPATGMFATVLLAGYGPEAVAAFGAASRIEALALIGIFAMSMSITPFVAQTSGLVSMTASTKL